MSSEYRGTEVCACGATFDVTASFVADVLAATKLWREAHVGHGTALVRSLRLVYEARERLAEIGEAQGCEAVASRRFYEGRLSALDDLGLIEGSPDAVAGR